MVRISARSTRSVAALMLTALLLVGMSYQRWTESDGASVRQAHTALQAMADAVPMTVGPWVGRAVEAAEPAVVPLRPVHLLSREYENVQTGRRVRLVFVWSRDRRDLTGYDPPRWYAQRGWSVLAAEPLAWRVAGQTVPATEYELSQPGGGAGSELLVGSFVALPDGEVVPSLSEVMDLAEDKGIGRAHGAALVQVGFPGDTPSQERERIVQTLMNATIMTIKGVAQEMHDE